MTNAEIGLAREIERLKGTTTAMEVAGDPSGLLKAHRQMLAYLEAKNGDPSAHPIMPWASDDRARAGE